MRRVLIALVLGASLAFSGTASAFAQTSITVSAPAAVRAYKSFVVRGTATGAIANGEGVGVHLQKASGGSWTTVSSVPAVVSGGGFSASMSCPSRGRYRVVAEIAASPAHPAAHSPAASVKAVGPKVVALTFDDGPWRGSTDKIVAILKANDVQATFFVLGAQAKGQPQRLKAIAAGGNLIGTHSFKHAMMSKRSAKANAADLKRCIQITQSVTGQRMRWFRPPGGATNASVRRTAAGLGLRQVMWSVDTRDYTQPGTSKIVSVATKQAKNGSVILMHDGGGNRTQTVKAVPDIIKRLKARGYDFVTLDELVALGYKPK